MKEPRFSFLFCDDIRLEQGGKRSLMGCVTQAVELQQPEIARLAICCLVAAPTSIDLSKYRVWVRMSVDGKKEEDIDFPKLPSRRAEPDNVPPALEFVRSLVPDVANKRRLIGVLKMEGGVRFRKYVKFTTFVDDDEMDCAVFFCSPASSDRRIKAVSTTAAKKAPKAARSTRK